MKTVYFVLGMHRSGTSAFTGVLQNVGMDVGSDLMPSTNENEKGYFENYKVFWLNEKVLKDNNLKWDSCQFENNNLKNIDLLKYVSEAKDILESEYKFTANILIKDPRNCLLFPMWEKACEELEYKIKVILPYRSPLEVAESLKKRDKIPYEKSLIIWVHHFLLAEYYSRNHERIFMYYDDLLDDTDSSLSEIEEFTKNKINETSLHKIKDFLNVSFKHNHIPVNNISEQIPEFLKSLFELLINRKFNDLQLFDKIREEFFYCLNLFYYNEINTSLNKLVELKALTAEQLSEIAIRTERQQLSDNHITNIENQSKSLESSLEKEQNAYQQLKTEIENLQNQNQKLVEQELTSKAENKQLKALQQDQIKEFSHLKSQLFNEVNDHNLTRENNKKLELKITQIENQIIESQSLESKVEQAEATNNILMAEKSKLETENTNFINQLKEKSDQIESLNISLDKQAKELNIINESKLNEITDIHIKENNRIGQQISKIKADAVHAVNIYSDSWHKKTDHEKTLSLKAINNLQLFYNINKRYLDKKNESRVKLIKKLNKINTGFKTATHPFKVLNIINQIRNIDLDIENINKRVNRVPWTFIHEFDEGLYLQMNNDVAKEVVKGRFLSGLEHFIFFGFDEVKFKGRRIAAHIPAYKVQLNLKSVEDNDYAFLKYLDNCYANNIIHVHNPAIEALQALDHISCLSNQDNNNNLLTDESNEVILNLNSEAQLSNEDDYIPVVYDYIEPQINDSIRTQMDGFTNKPLISIIMPVYNVEPKWLELAIQSITRQWYENWELCIVDDNSQNKATLDFLNEINNEKIRVHYSKTNGNISVASNTALLMTKGDYIALMDNDDELTPDALFEVVKVINKHGAEFIYSDEDKLEMDGTFSDPHFKPDFSPDLFLSQNYMSHLGVIKKDLMIKSDGFSKGLEGSQDYDLYLKVLERTKKIHHIPKVLYHWRKVPGSTAAEFSDKSYAQDAGKQALKNAMKRRKIKADVVNAKHPGTYRVKYHIIDEPLVSIIIPFKDMPELLEMCLSSILNLSTYKNFEIIGMSNNSTETETYNVMKKFSIKDKRIKFYKYNHPFNFSKINNHAVYNYAKGEHIILLNNDIEIISPDWIESMLELSQRKETGAVGAKLYYPNDTIQHMGVAIGVLTLAGHSFKHHPRQAPAYMGKESVVHNVSAVTAACLMIKKQIFKEVEGLNEEKLKIAFNDIDFCLKVADAGYINVVTPYCEAYHHESVSRGYEDTPKKKQRFNSEVAYMQKKYKKILKNGDPFYNVNLTLEREDYSLRG